MQTLLGQAPNFADPTGRLGYVHSFSFGIQRLLPGQVTRGRLLRRIAHP